MVSTRFSAAAPDPTMVSGRLRRYQCRTVGDVDAHLRVLAARLPLLQPQHRESHRVDIDALLDRRLHLMRANA